MIHTERNLFSVNDFLTKDTFDKKHFLINKDELHLWLFKLSSVPNYNLFEILSLEEQKRASSFLFEPHKIFFSYCHSYLRILISLYNHCDPTEIKFQRTISGKPYLTSQTQNLKFNMSHSGEALLLGFALDNELGIDLQRINYNLDWKELIQTVLTLKEKNMLVHSEVLKRLRNYM